MMLQLQSQARRNAFCDILRRTCGRCGRSVAISVEKKRLLRHFATNMWALWSFSCNLKREETPFATFCDEHVGAVVVQLQSQSRRNAFCDILRRTCGRCGRSVAISVEKKRLLRRVQPYFLSMMCGD